MSTRRRRRPAGAEPPPGGLLNWSSSAHWSEQQLPCRYCGAVTNLRDSTRAPAHKTCAEIALTRQAAETAEAYENGTL